MVGMAQKDNHAAGFVSVLAGFARDAAPRAVFPLFLGLAGRRILAILAEEVQAALVVDNSGMFMVTMHFALCSLVVDSPRCLSSWPVWTSRSRLWRRAENCGCSAVAVPQGRRFSCRVAEAHPMVLWPYYLTRWSMSLFCRSC